MKFLRKILVTLGLIVLLALLKILFRKLFPLSLIFHFNLFSALQLMLFIWALLTGLLDNTVWKKLAPSTKRWRGLVLCLVLLGLSEISCRWLLLHPEHIPDNCLIPFRYYYNNFDRNILQFDPRITRYDPGLFYRMIPNNRSLFTNVEFSDSVTTDSLGFREPAGLEPAGREAVVLDPAAHGPGGRGHAVPDPALSAGPPTIAPNAGSPTIAFLGDSYTLGWGVRQNECFPSLIAHLLGARVINTGMSSYGTAREIASLRALDGSNISTVVIQYCYNDADENEACVNNDFRPVISPRSTFDSAVTVLRWSKVWYPGKYCCTLLKLFADQQLGRLPKDELASLSVDPVQYAKEAERFAAILRHSGIDFGRTRVFVFDIGEYWMLTGQFTDALQRELNTPENNAFFHGNVRVLHIEHLLTPSDYYRLDAHIRPSGHLKLARYLAAAISEQAAGSPPPAAPSPHIAGNRGR